MADATHIRLLLCLACKSLEEMPDYVGNPDNDDVLTVLVSRHTQKHPTQTNSGQLMRVEKKHWDSPSTRAAIEKQVRESTGHTGFDIGYYATKATFQDDAFKCWQAHNRTTDCGDYKAKKMLLQPDTNADRKAEGLDKYESKTYLCHFCPMESLVVTAARKKSGMYN
jgi:hypothetical protein